MESFKDRLISILRWSERYTKTDMVYLASGGMWLGVAQLSASVAAFVLTVVLANVLTQETLGEYRFLMAALMILGIFALPGMRISLIDSTPRGFRKNLLFAIRIIRKFSYLGSFVAICLAFWYGIQENHSLCYGFLVIAALFPLFESTSPYIEHLKAIRDFKETALYTTITRVFLVIITIFSAIVFPSQAWVVIGAFLLGNIIPNIIFQHRTIKLTIGEKDVEDPAIYRYARRLSVIALLSLIALQLDKILVWKFLGSEELAIFFMALAFPQEISRFLTIAPTLAFPKFSTGKIEELRKTLLPKIMRYFVLVGLVVALYIVSAPSIFSLLFPHYLDSVFYSQLIALSILSSAFSPITTFLTTQKNVKALYALAITIPGTKILVAFLLIPLFGILGAVYAILIESILSIVCLCAVFLLSKPNPSLKVT